MNESPDTKSRILDVAEHLFGTQGLDRVSIRDITDAAQVNLGAINYHFGSKDELIGAVFERRIGSVNRERIAALDAIEKAAGDKPPQLEAILEAFIQPAFKCVIEGPKCDDAFAKLFGRCLAETRPEVESLLKKQFEPVMKKMISVLSKALPHLSRPDIFWRMKFTFGALHHLLLTKDKRVPAWAEVDAKVQMKKLVSFATAGFRA